MLIEKSIEFGHMQTAEPQWLNLGNVLLKRSEIAALELAVQQLEVDPKENKWETFTRVRVVNVGGDNERTFYTELTPEQVTERLLGGEQ